MKKINKKLLTTLLLVGVVSSSVYAGTVLEKVTAYKNNQITYRYNGEEVLAGEGAIVYEDSVYVPLRKVSEALGVSVDYKNGEVILKDNKITNVVTKDVEEIGIVKEVTDNSVTILPIGEEDVVYSYIELENTGLNISHIKEGDRVKVFRDEKLTKSIPAKSKLQNIEILENLEYENVEVLSIDTIRKAILIKTEKQGEVEILVSDETNITTNKDRRRYSFEDITKDNIVSITPSEAMTLSLPPMTVAQEIVITMN